jgi:hypothetical protein
MSDESRRTSTQSHGSSGQSVRGDLPTGMVEPVAHQLSRRSSYIQASMVCIDSNSAVLIMHNQEESDPDLYLALDAENAMSRTET